MYNQYENVLRSVLKYEETQKTIIIVSAVAVLCAIFFIAFKYIPVKKTADKWCKYFVLSILTLAFIGYTIYSHIYTSDIEKDIQDKDYVVYSGAFTHDDYQKDSFYHYIYTIGDDGSKYQLKYPDYGNHHGTYQEFETLPFDTFHGTIVYGKNSKIVVHWEINNSN